jgi:hypothetical protein
MQAVIVDCIPVVNPQLASIIRDDAVSIVAQFVDSHAASPTDGEVIASSKSRPSTTLAEVESILHVDTSTVYKHVPSSSIPICPRDFPSISGVFAPVPEQHPSMATPLKHFESHKNPSTTKMSVGLSIAPTVQAIIIDCVPIVDPQLASIIGNNTKSVMSCVEDSHSGCPAHGKMIAAGEMRPPAVRIAVIHGPKPSSHVWSATMQIRASTTLTEVEDIHPVVTMAVCGSEWSRATCTNYAPSSSSISTIESQQHACVTTMLKKFEPH